MKKTHSYGYFFFTHHKYMEKKYWGTVYSDLKSSTSNLLEDSCIPPLSLSSLFIISI